MLKKILDELKKLREDETRRQNAEWKAMEDRADERLERLARNKKWFK